MKQAKWFQNATMMAFLAVFALLVSPALALGCCHTAAPAHSLSPGVSRAQHAGAHHRTRAVAHQSAAPQSVPAHACCAPAKPLAKSVVKRAKSTVCAFEMGAVATSDCSCDQALSRHFYTASDPNASSSFVSFAPALAAIPFALELLIEDVRLAASAHHAARPRSPDRTSAPGRAPPVLALS